MEGAWASMPSRKLGRPSQGQVSCIHSIYFLPQTLWFPGAWSVRPGLSPGQEQSL